MQLFRHGARCLVTTLRDPASRLVTAFRFENAVRWPATGSARLSQRLTSKHEIGPEGRPRYLKSSPLIGPFGTIENPVLIPAIMEAGWQRAAELE